MTAGIITSMNKRTGLQALLIALCLFLAAGIPSGPAAGEQEHTVLKVYDGDTILVTDRSGRKRVRLLGIDAPETSKGRGQPGQPYSQKSRRHLSDLILNRKITLATFGEDAYQRLLAVVFCEGRDINLAMIEAGLAEVYRGRTPRSFDKAPYREAESRARQAMAGMWRQGADYVSPIRWKHPR